MSVAHTIRYCMVYLFPGTGDNFFGTVLYRSGLPESERWAQQVTDIGMTGKVIRKISELDQDPSVENAEGEI